MHYNKIHLHFIILLYKMQLDVFVPGFRHQELEIDAYDAKEDLRTAIMYNHPTIEDLKKEIETEIEKLEEEEKN